MTTTASIEVVPHIRARTATYQHARWYFLAALAVTIAGFWPSFFRRLGGGEFWHSLHGVTATLWIVALATQSWLMSRGHVRWHRRVAVGALVVLPLLITSALYMVAVMVRGSLTATAPAGSAVASSFLLPLAASAFLAFIDLPTIAFVVVLVRYASLPMFS